jgi:hypothetical protein
MEPVNPLRFKKITGTGNSSNSDLFSKKQNPRFSGSEMYRKPELVVLHKFE